MKIISSKNNKDKNNITAATSLDYLKEGYSYDDDIESQSDEDLLDSFVDNYWDSDMAIDDAINEYADSYVSVYTADIFKAAYGLWASGAYEEAVSNGLTEGVTDLVKVLQIAWYVYNETLLYNNLEAIITNIAIAYIESQGYEIANEEFTNLCISLPEDNNDTIGDIRVVVDQFFGVGEAARD